MKCPLQRFTVRYKPGETKVEFTDCIKEKCAWWDNAGQCCAVYLLGEVFTEAMTILSRIEDKLLKGDQR